MLGKQLEKYNMKNEMKKEQKQRIVETFKGFNEAFDPFRRTKMYTNADKKREREEFSKYDINSIKEKLEKNISFLNSQISKVLEADVRFIVEYDPEKFEFLLTSNNLLTSMDTIGYNVKMVLFGHLSALESGFLFFETKINYNLGEGIETNYLEAFPGLERFIAFGVNTETWKFENVDIEAIDK
jgi:hypothetical protein